MKKSFCLCIALLAVSTVVFSTSTHAAKKKRNKQTPSLPDIEFDLSGQAEAPDEPLSLWYRQPARTWGREALPVGNGRLGCMVFGGYKTERICLNEDSVWSGALIPKIKDEGLTARLPGVNKLLFEEKFAEAEKLLWTIIKPSTKAQEGYFGHSEVLGNLNLEFDGPDSASDYRRGLNLDSGIASVRYVQNGVTFTREVFASEPDQVIVVRLTADKPGSVSFTASLTRSERGVTVADGADALTMSGRLDGREGDKSGLNYIACLKAVNEGGKVAVQGGKLRIESADAVTLFIAAATDYRPVHPEFRGNPHEEITKKQMDDAVAKSYDALRSAHVADHQALFRRVDIKLGTTPEDRAVLPTDQRTSRFRRNTDDPGLITLLFQYGRYMLIASSRPGALPANLQGIWIENTKPAWNGDYHLDLNIQMNYWPVEVCNLSECFLPVVDLMETLVPSGRQTARLCHGAGGWTAHIRANIFGYTWPRENNRWGYSAGSGAWALQTVWDHYAFTLDKDYLRRVWPLFREAGLFWLDWTFPDPKTGKLVTGPSSSPETTFLGPDGKQYGISMGTTYDQQCAWELFTEILDAAQALEIEDDYVKRVREARANLLGPQIDDKGRLMEWARDYRDAKPHHRHRAHLVALHPGRQIALMGPEYMKAAELALEARGHCPVNWALSWDTAFNARLKRASEALERANATIKQSMANNLFSAGSAASFQIDGNLGFTSGIAEMLIQSHTDQIELLPCLPKAWADGLVSGLCARGGFEIRMGWKAGKLTSASVLSKCGGKCRVRYGDETAEFETEKGKRYNLRKHFGF